MALPSARFSAVRRRENHPNLIGAWSFNEGAGSVARDNSEHNKPLTVDVGLTWPAGHVSGTGIANANVVGSAHWATWVFGSQITMMGWARPLDLTAGTNRALFGVWDTPDTSGATQMAVWAQRGDFSTSNVLQGNVRIDGNLTAINQSALALNTWVHVALSYDGSTIRLFRDGSLVTSVSNAGTIQNPTAFHFCVVPDTANAQVDDIRVFDIGFTTSAQVTAFMNDPVLPS